MRGTRLIATVTRAVHHRGVDGAAWITIDTIIDGSTIACSLPVPRHWSRCGGQRELQSFVAVLGDLTPNDVRGLADGEDVTRCFADRKIELAIRRDGTARVVRAVREIDGEVSP